MSEPKMSNASTSVAIKTVIAAVGNAIAVAMTNPIQWFKDGIQQLANLRTKMLQAELSKKIDDFEKWLNKFDDIKTRGHEIGADDRVKFRENWTTLCQEQRFNTENHVRIVALRLAFNVYNLGILAGEPIMRSYGQWIFGEY
jgi:hypothetical protein